jgi:hypothetical protein
MTILYHTFSYVCFAPSLSVWYDRNKEEEKKIAETDELILTKVSQNSFISFHNFISFHFPPNVPNGPSISFLA